MKQFEKITVALATAFNRVAGAAVLGMMLITCMDVVLRLFRKPIPGTYELVAYFGGIAVAFAMADTTLSKGHVAVNILLRRFPKVWQNVIDSFTNILGCGLFAVAAWKILQMGWDYQVNGHVSMTLHVPLYPVAYGMGIALLVVSLGLFVTCLKHVGKVVGKWG